MGTGIGPGAAFRAGRTDVEGDYGGRLQMLLFTPLPLCPGPTPGETLRLHGTASALRGAGLKSDPGAIWIQL